MCCVGKDKIHNALYGSSSAEKAAIDIGLRFPGPFALERTLALIKPYVIQNGYLTTVMEVIADNGFTVLASETLNMSAERAEQLYASQRQRPDFSGLVRNMSSGPCFAMVLCKPGAVAAWKKLVGPTDVEVAKATKPLSLRARFGTDNCCDGFHCSDSAETATKEIKAYFSQLPVEKIPSLLEVEEVLNEKPEPRPHAPPSKSLQDVLVEGLTDLCRIKPVGIEAITWLGEWLLRNNPNKPVVEAPAELHVEVPVREALNAGNEGSKVVWAVGAPGSSKDEQCAYIVKEFGYEYIDVITLIAATEASGNDYGEVIKDCKRQGKSVPTHITTNLIKDAMLNCKGSSKFLVNSFPSSLDEAFDFESRVGEVDLMLYFDCSDQTRNMRLQESNISLSDQQIKAFKEAVIPVLDHYSSFSKIANVSTDGSSAQVTGRVRRLFR
jgi:nucleoside diphosphate kinase/adenylate kinase family enzyme